MIALEVFGRSSEMAKVAELLEGVEGVSRVRLVAATRVGYSVVSAAVRSERPDGMSS